jgi:hypothetical protein
MVSLSSLWMPILLSAVLVFVASSVIHMATPWHKGDIKPVPNEDDVMAALRRFKIPPGDYGLPCASSMQEMNSPAFKAKMEAGPTAFMTVTPPGLNFMGGTLAVWFVYCIVVAVFAAYVASRALAPATAYLQVFRFAGTTAFACYGMALPQHSIWYKRSWATTIKSIVDALLYGMLTGGAFGWLWPR